MIHQISPFHSCHTKDSNERRGPQKDRQPGAKTRPETGRYRSDYQRSRCGLQQATVPPQRPDQMAGEEERLV